MHHEEAHHVAVVTASVCSRDDKPGLHRADRRLSTEESSPVTAVVLDVALLCSSTGGEGGGRSAVSSNADAHVPACPRGCRCRLQSRCQNKAALNPTAPHPPTGTGPVIYGRLFHYSPLHV